MSKRTSAKSTEGARAARRFSLCRLGIHTPQWAPEDGYGDDPCCKRCGIPMWANYAGYGVNR